MALRDPEFHEFDRDFNDPASLAWAPSAPDFWQRASRAMEVVIYLLLLLGILRLFQPETAKQRRLNAELAQVQALKTEREARVAALRQEFDLLKSDREYLETIARDRLDKAREGEYIVRIEREEPATEPAAPANGERVVRPLNP
jgi:cell division protein FtsB